MVLDRLADRLRAVLPAGWTGADPTGPGEVTQVPDDLPPTTLAAPVRVDRLTAEWNADEARAEFRVVVRDAEGRRCPDLAVEATITGPTRAASAEITTDLMGAAIFRMADGPGGYRIEVLDVGARGIAWDPEAGAGTHVDLDAA